MSSASVKRRGPEIWFAAVPAPPCDRCAFTSQCRAQRLACLEFLHFTDEMNHHHMPGAPRLPTRAIYALLFGGSESDRAIARRAAGRRGAARRRELQAGDDSLHRYADRIKARAIRRGGELLKRVKPANGRRTDIEPRQGAHTRSGVAEAAGLSDRQKKTMLRVANVPAEIP